MAEKKLTFNLSEVGMNTCIIMKMGQNNHIKFYLKRILLSCNGRVTRYQGKVRIQEPQVTIHNDSFIAGTDRIWTRTEQRNDYIILTFATFLSWLSLRDS